MLCVWESALYRCTAPVGCTSGTETVVCFLGRIPYKKRPAVVDSKVARRVFHSHPQCRVKEGFDLGWRASLLFPDESVWG